MTCCSSMALSQFSGREDRCSGSAEEIALASRDLGDGLRQTILFSPDMRCGACVVALESRLIALPGVELARANLTTKRITINWRTPGNLPPDFLGEMGGLGYPAFISSDEFGQTDQAMGHLLRALAVAGFCSMNIMVLSVSVWSGADHATAVTLHLLSALLAMPAIFYSGATYYRSAWKALRHRRVNMDVPVTIGVLLTFALSLYDAATGASRAYFEAATSLLFVLLVGRTLEHFMRSKARSAASALSRLMPKGATILKADGSFDYLPLEAVEAGTLLVVARGDRVPVDGVVRQGVAEIDRSIMTGESRLALLGPGGTVHAGGLNTGDPLIVEATASPETSSLAELTRVVEGMENSSSSYSGIADRAARLYAPVVHSLSAAALVLWWIVSGDFHLALSIAISVLIITCPCALGLAVPMAHVMAAKRLFEHGIVVKEGTALERLVEIDTVVFDKTGTLTAGEPKPNHIPDIDKPALAIAAALARHSNHPLARSITAMLKSEDQKLPLLTCVREIPGRGMEGQMAGEVYRLGSEAWATHSGAIGDHGTVLSRDGASILSFTFTDRLRVGALETISDLRRQGLFVQILSGDSDGAVARIAGRTGVDIFTSETSPLEKIEFVQSLRSSGRTVLMIGDGVNDAGALTAANSSMAPGTASDISRSAADFVLMRDDLRGVTEALATAKQTMQIIRQNLGIAVAYNALSIPIALSGNVTPLIAAIAMSISSLSVVGNAMRLRTTRRTDERTTGFEPAMV
ncbi:heavy metal translocating P-type ATPase [Agrobacterium pusense]|uniref:heavy metal translocating P-type ATPase n=1 Tax=Agrobacterium pusense TaxID=648995 RepID=UPI000512B655|nr:hypothetical protein BA939_19885 [Rhizobium sp. S41]KGE79763.1 hypothetical protein LW14_27255 [Rhizobium sp. H41]QCM14169.1 cadmium-translocating P-type ATPase [Agrobacterium tumefaciens]QWW77360.1 cadmium-translocating P-type ATPase [Agrobacterium pusense]HAU78699.1 cadmium-translocating P-type ATPase [Agrobacterium sp.]